MNVSYNFHFFFSFLQKPIIKIYNKDNINFFSLLQNHSYIYIYIKGNKNKEYTESSLNSAAISRKCVSDHEISVQFAHRPLFRAKKFVSIIHGVSSFEYFILEVIAISIFSLSLSRFFTDFSFTKHRPSRRSIGRNLSWRENPSFTLVHQSVQSDSAT